MKVSKNQWCFGKIANNSFFTDPKLYYWQRDAKNANAEIDYLSQIENKVVPIEIKAGKTGTLKSLQLFLFENKKETGIRFNSDLPGIGRDLQTVISYKNKKSELNYNLISLPLYFASFLEKIEELLRAL